MSRRSARPSPRRRPSPIDDDPAPGIAADEALLAQGRASAQGASTFAQFGLPRLSGLAEMLARPNARILDVGTGVAALAVAYAELFRLSLSSASMCRRARWRLAAETVEYADPFIWSRR